MAKLDIQGLGYGVGFCTLVYLTQGTFVCFPSTLSARQTSKRVFSLQETTKTLRLVKSVALIGPKNAPKTCDHRITG